jgi:hypothetical protein
MDLGIDHLTGQNLAAPKMERKELVSAITLLIVGVLLRLVYIFHFRIDSDEPQHAHLVWAWVHGLLPYRDVFDNHSPLFQFLWSPIFRLIGETPDVVLWLRLTLLPCYFLTLWAIYRIGETLYNRRVGLWGAVLSGLCPGFSFCSLEFRPDGFWAALWFVAIAILVRPQLTLSRSFLMGLMLGAALAVSMKTILMLLALAAGTLMVMAIVLRNSLKFSLGRLVPNIVMALVGFLLVPAVTVAFFASQGALEPLYYGTVQHNLLAQPETHHAIWIRLAVFFCGVMVVGLVALVILWRDPHSVLASRRVLVWVSTGIYFLLLLCFWPLLESEHFLPFYPLLLLLCVPWLLVIPFGKFKLPIPGYWMVGLVAMAELIIMLGVAVPWQDHTRKDREMLAEVLRLTSPGDEIMDLKGETIFRQRPFYFGFEKITRRAIQSGTIVDDVPESLIRTGTCVATGDTSRFPPLAREFLRENYLPVGYLRVAGMFLTPAAVSLNTMPFEIKIPARYAVILAQGAATGRLDGNRYQGSLLLAAGHHEYQLGLGETKAAVLWAQAVERGFSPFQANERR